MWSSHLSKLLAQLNEVDSREPRLERASTSCLSPPRLVPLRLAQTFHRRLSLSLSLKPHELLCVYRYNTPRTNTTGTAAAIETATDAGVCRKGKRDPPSLSFITQVSTRPAIFLPPLHSYVTDLASTGGFFFFLWNQKRFGLLPTDALFTSPQPWLVTGDRRRRTPVKKLAHSAGIKLVRR